MGASLSSCCSDRPEAAKELTPLGKSKGSDGTHIDGSVIIPLVQKLSSADSVELSNITFSHVWASKPQTVAAQSAMLIAMRVRRANVLSVTQAFLRAGCVKPLLSLLKDTSSRDKQDAAIVALLAIVEQVEQSDNKDNSKPDLGELLTRETIVLLTRIMNDKTQSEGARMSCAGIEHGLMKLEPTLRKIFIECNGVPALVKLLEHDQSHSADSLHFQWILERITDIREMLQETAGKVDTEIAKLLVKAGCRDKLEKLKQTGYTDLRDDAQVILNLLRVY